MNQRQRTIAMIVLAALAALITWITRPAPTVDARYADIGQPLVEALTDPGQVAQVEVIAYDTDRARHSALLLRFTDGRWIIPSAYDYPADASARIAETASMLVGLKREAVVTERRIDHASLGLIDPTDESGDPEGRGVKLTITSAEGDTLADVMIGDAFEGVERERFVRLAGSDRAYRTTFHAPPGEALSTSLVDWINPDLLRLSTGDIASVRVDTATVDESQGARLEGERYTIARTTSGGEGGWELFAQGETSSAAENPETSSAAEAIAEAIVGLRLVGVEPMPGKLSALVTGADSDIAFDQSDLLNLQRAGFFISPRGEFIANAGNMIIETTDGLAITLWFGELTESFPSAGSLFGPETQPTAEPGTEARYVLVSVRPTDPTNPEASQAAADRARRLARWWFLIEESDARLLRPPLQELAGSANPGATDQQPSP